MKKCSLIVFLFSFLLCNCGGTDYSYVDTRDQKAGPGLFSGEDGAFTVVKKDADTDKKEEDLKDKSDSE
jgi:hypothetical protein